MRVQPNRFLGKPRAAAENPAPAHGLEDFVPQVEEIISVGEFYEKSAGGQIIFT